MPNIQVISASIVVLGERFTPALMTPDLLAEFFPGEQPSGIATDVVTQLEYRNSAFRMTLEENKVQVLKRQARPTHLDLLARVLSSFLDKNPLVRLTAVGLNFDGFVRYGSTRRGRRRGDEALFLSTYAAPDALGELVGSELQHGVLTFVYEAQDSRCRLVLRSDAVMNDNEGVALDLNVHKDVSDGRPGVDSQTGNSRDWYRYFVEVGERLATKV